MTAYIRVVGSTIGKFNSVVETYTVANGVTITAGDFCYFTLGTITNATVTSSPRLIGMAASTVVGDGTKTIMIYVSPYNKYLIQTSDGTNAATNIGQFFSLTGATGAQTIDVGTASTTAGHMLQLAYNPQINPVQTDTTWGVFTISKHLFHQ